MRAEYICPVLTAFDENGKVDMEAMKRQFDHLIEGGLNGIAIMGSSGEFYAMTLEEAMAFARDSIAYLKDKIPVYIGTGRLIADETIQFSNYVLDQGATAVMIVGPYYIGTDDAELCHGQDVDNIGNDSVHADKFRTHIQIHRPLAEKSKNQECKLRKHTEKAVSK